jgi:alkanesulfonate monooxygenase SsuD/methylene tetrahydromethanopterin reductase-like flavin-dependent oxidoreductase (luciferase family)
MKTKNGVSLGISLPYSFPDARVDHAYIRRFVRQAEALGFDDGWLTEGILNPNFVLEPVTYIAHLAALTEKIRLGISVIILNHRNPIQLAKQLATVDHLSNGRLTVGFGLGAGTSLYPAFGIGQEKRVTRFEEAMRVMTALWTQERVTLDGQFWKLSNQGMQPRPKRLAGQNRRPRSAGAKRRLAMPSAPELSAAS